MCVPLLIPIKSNILHITLHSPFHIIQLNYSHILSYLYLSFKNFFSFTFLNKPQKPIFFTLYLYHTFNPPIDNNPSIKFQAFFFSLKKSFKLSLISIVFNSWVIKKTVKFWFFFFLFSKLFCFVLLLWS